MVLLAHVSPAIRGFDETLIILAILVAIALIVLVSRWIVQQDSAQEVIRESMQRDNMRE